MRKVNGRDKISEAISYGALDKETGEVTYKAELTPPSMQYVLLYVVVRSMRYRLHRNYNII